MEFLFAHTGLIMALLLAATGILVWRFPRLLRGYYTVSDAKQQEVDWSGLRRFLLLGFLFLGALVATLDLLIRQEEIASAVRLTIVFVGVLALIGTGQRYTHSKK